MKNPRIKLRGAASDGRFNILEPCNGLGCAYIVELGNNDALWDIHCSDVELELISDTHCNLTHGNSRYENLPYQTVENTTKAQMRKCAELAHKQQTLRKQK